jgi:hypothetical protein
MLYDIGHQEAPRDCFPSRRDREGGQPDKRTPGTIFLIAGLFAHQHDRRGRGAVTNNRLRRANILANSSPRGSPAAPNLKSLM